ncbi:hypothetical protein [Phyllobacterium sp. K27]
MKPPPSKSDGLVPYAGPQAAIGHMDEQALDGVVDPAARQLTRRIHRLGLPAGF